MFGKRREGRRALHKRAFEVLLKAWTGDAFKYEGGAFASPVCT